MRWNLEVMSLQSIFEAKLRTILESIFEAKLRTIVKSISEAKLRTIVISISEAKLRTILESISEAKLRTKKWKKATCWMSYYGSTRAAACTAITLSDQLLLLTLVLWPVLPLLSSFSFSHKSGRDATVA